MSLFEINQCAFQDRVTVIVRESNAYPASQRLCEKSADALQFGNHPARSWQEFSAIFSETHAACLSFEQSQTNRVFQFSELHADRRLSPPQLGRGMCHILALDDRQEGP